MKKKVREKERFHKLNREGQGFALSLRILFTVVNKKPGLGAKKRQLSVVAVQ